MKVALLMILGALPFLLVPVAFIASVKIDPVWTALSPEERTLLDYTPEENRVIGLRTNEEPEEAFVSGAGLFEVKKKTGPLTTASQAGGEGAGGKDNKERDGGYGELTLLVFNGERSMAVINGAVVRRGETVEGMTVKRIEKDRVLVLDKNLRWIYMEGKR